MPMGEKARVVGESNTNNGEVVEVVMWIDVINGVASALSKVGKKGYEALMAWLKKLKNKVDDVVPSFIIKDAQELTMFALANGLRKDIDIAFVIKMTQGDSKLIESILLSTKEVIEGKTVIELYSFLKLLTHQFYIV